MVGAVRLVLDEGKTIGAVARELDLTPSALGNWVRQARADRSQGKTGLTTEERTELARLRKENRELRMECTAPGFLDSGLTVFASTPPRPARGGRVAPGPGFGSRTSPASTARCTSA